ncbi:serine hydrolase domain-containing protein [Marinimicrobium alkaliphilum]|uniref:serine hydrolase domain-containing protein n=1 Tax=Marinimicrobium alkaliphilum TaxID=2202654 RepID=UPI000DBA245B|nr:serine hydrolase [Marinimicrobium alkaliphilum]
MHIKALYGRLVGYGALLFLFAWLAHLYVTNPLYVKRLPYFFAAWQSGAAVRCDATAPPELDRLLKRASLPFFSLNGEAVFVGRDGATARCGVYEDGRTRMGLFRFASLTKVITSFAALELAGEQKLDLHAPVLTYFPEVNVDHLRDPRVAEITLWHMLNHSSGLGGPFGSDNMVTRGEKPWCPYDISVLEKVRLAGEPGSNHGYNNVAYCLAGEIISRAAGADYQRYISDTYFAGYESLSFTQGDYLPQEPIYDLSNDFRFDADYVHWLDFNALAPAAGLMGNPEEFARLIRDLFIKNPDILQAGRIENCREKGIERCYSYAFTLYDTDKGVVGVQHGYLPGASSLVAVNEQGDTLVWVAPGAALEPHHRERMAQRVVAILTRN